MEDTAPSNRDSPSGPAPSFLPPASRAGSRGAKATGDSDPGHSSSRGAAKTKRSGRLRTWKRNSAKSDEKVADDADLDSGQASLSKRQRTGSKANSQRSRVERSLVQEKEDEHVAAHVDKKRMVDASGSDDFGDEVAAQPSEPLSEDDADACDNYVQEEEPDGVAFVSLSAMRKAKKEQ